MRIDDVGLLEFGNTIKMAGVAYIGDGTVYLALFPEENAEGLPIVNLDMNLEDWTRFLRQTDLLETQVLSRASDGTLTKAIVRKSQRHIARSVAWEVYRRAGFKCSYCGTDNAPLTVDHLVLWEDGGPSIKDNLQAACHRCNKARGNLQYAAWLEHPYYKKVSRNLDPAVRQANQALVETLGSIPRQVHQPTHR